MDRAENGITPDLPGDLGDLVARHLAGRAVAVFYETGLDTDGGAVCSLLAVNASGERITGDLAGFRDRARSLGEVL